MLPDSLPPWVGAVLFGWIFIAAVGAFILGRICAANQQDDDDPDRATPRSPEDVWRSAYDESDGDHETYVKWRRK